MRMKHTRSLILVPVVMAVLVGCGKKEAPKEVTTPAVTEAPKPRPTLPPVQEVAKEDLPERLRSAIGVRVPPRDMVTIPDLKLQARPGQSVILEVKVMGAPAPFDEHYARVLVGDENTVASCDLLGVDDRCETPWDVHLEDPAAVKTGTAIIQFVDEEGEVIETGLRGAAGIKELSRLRVSGIVSPESSPEELVINASAIEILR